MQIAFIAKSLARWHSQSPQDILHRFTETWWLNATVGQSPRPNAWFLFLHGEYVSVRPVTLALQLCDSLLSPAPLLRPPHVRTVNKASAAVQGASRAAHGGVINGPAW